MRPAYTALIDLDGETLAVGRFLRHANAVAYGQAVQHAGHGVFRGVARYRSTDEFRVELATNGTTSAALPHPDYAARRFKPA